MIEKNGTNGFLFLGCVRKVKDFSKRAHKYTKGPGLLYNRAIILCMQQLVVDMYFVGYAFYRMTVDLFVMQQASFLYNV